VNVTDVDNPVVSLISPANNSWSDTNNLTFIFNVSDYSSTLNCSLYINNILNQTNETTLKNTETSFNVSGLSEGTNQNYTVNCIDSDGNQANESRTFNIDLTNPESNITSGNLETSDNTPTITVNLSDNLASNLSYIIYVNDEINKQGSGIVNGELTDITLNQLDSTTNEVIIEAEDLAGNKVNSSAITITLSGTIVYLSSPANNYISNLSNINFTFSFSSGSNTLNCSLYLDDVLNQTNESSPQGLYVTFEVENIEDKKEIEWKVECIDSDEPSINTSSSRLLTVDTTTPTWDNHNTSRPSGYPHTQVPTQFNITFTDNIEMDSVIMENNFTGSWVNNTMTCVGSVEKNCVYSVVVPFGNYSYRFIGNDTAGWTNITSYFNYSATTTSANFNLFLDSQASDIWVDQGHNAEIYVQFISPEAGTIYIYEDGVFIGSCSVAQGCFRYETYNTPGDYNISTIFYSTYIYATTSQSYIIHVNTANLSFVSPTPEENATIYQNYAVINITTTNNLSTATLNWSGTNYDMNISGNNAYKNLTNLDYGFYEYSVFVEDINGNEETSGTRNVTLANHIPNITSVWNIPQNPGKESNIIIYINISDDDTGQTMNCSLSGDLTGSNTTATNSGNLTIPISIGNKSIGTYYYNVTCNDGYNISESLNNELIVLGAQLSEKINVTFITPVRSCVGPTMDCPDPDNLAGCFITLEHGATVLQGPNCYTYNENILINVSINTTEQLTNCQATLNITPDNLMISSPTLVLGDLNGLSYINWSVNVSYAGEVYQSYVIDVDVTCDSDYNYDEIDINTTHDWGCFEISLSKDEYYRPEPMITYVNLTKNDVLFSAGNITWELRGTGEAAIKINTLVDNSVLEESTGMYNTTFNSSDIYPGDYGSNPLVHQHILFYAEGENVCNGIQGDYQLFPPLPTNFWGNVLINSENASVGTIVTAYDSNETQCGSFTVTTSGRYGSLSCSGDDPATAGDEGAIENENITFKINGINATATGNISWNTATTKNVNLSLASVIMLTSPSNSSITNNASLFTWSYSDTSSTNYSLLIDDNSDFSSPEKNISDIEDLSYTLPSELNDGVYYWKVQVYDDGVFDSETSAWQFTLDTITPNVTNLQVQPSQINVSQNVNITVNVMDDIAMGVVLVQITDPNNASVNYTMSNVTSLYNLTYTVNSAGNYNIKIIANDSAGNINDTISTTFEVNGLSVTVTNPTSSSLHYLNSSFWLNSTTNIYGVNLTNCNATITISNESVLNISSGYNLTINLGNLTSGSATSADWNISANENGFANITIISKCSGITDANDTITNLQVQTTGTCNKNINLYSSPDDMNLISFPCSPDNESVTNVLSSISGNYDAIWAYDTLDTNDPWKGYDPDVPAWVNDLYNVTSTKGYWVKMNTNDTLETDGTILDVTEITLYSSPDDMNLIGYPSLTSRAVYDTLTPISGNYDAIWAYDTLDTNDHWKGYDPDVPVWVNDLYNVTSTKGYWIKMNANDTLSVQK